MDDEDVNINNSMDDSASDISMTGRVCISGEEVVIVTEEETGVAVNARGILPEWEKVVAGGGWYSRMSWTFF